MQLVQIGKNKFITKNCFLTNYVSHIHSFDVDIYCFF